MDRQPVLEGERLILRPLRESDWDALYAVASDPRLWAHHPLHDRWQEPVFREFFADALAHRGALAAVEKATGEIVGSSRFQNHRRDNGGSVEIGWTFLARRVWGLGYNAEMKRLMLAHALASVERATFRVGVDNVISRKAQANIGSRLTDQIELIETPHGVVPHAIYEMTRELFAASPLNRPA